MRLDTSRRSPPAQQQQASERSAAHHAAALLRVRLPLALRHAPHNAVNPGPVPVLAGEQAAVVFRGAGRASVRGLSLHLHRSSRLRLAPPPPATARRVACRHVARGKAAGCCGAALYGSRSREHARSLTAAGHTTQTAFAGPSAARRAGRAPVASPAHCTASLPSQRPPWLSTCGSVCVRLCCRSSVHHLWQAPAHQRCAFGGTPYMFDFPSIGSMDRSLRMCLGRGSGRSSKTSSFATCAHAKSAQLAGPTSMEERQGTQREPPCQEAPPAHFIAKTAVPACTVVAMAVGCFRRAGVQDTVLCKGNALELLSSTEHGDLESLHEQGAGGLVSALGVLPAEAATYVRSACICPFVLCAAPACLVLCGKGRRDACTPWRRQESVPRAADWPAPAGGPHGRARAAVRGHAQHRPLRQRRAPVRPRLAATRVTWSDLWLAYCALQATSSA